ncbi:hypothetical protein BDV28DRAFT_144548 [Aspergillus coremiiformis]|uniref:Uncharacterized protein n=1 Tax=Aspergillus coremiiformis TaxID=138285 RepID=A0A5N6YR44_9EURO|nr:hypothetical protein BDV28DRAFT_144548 [Aspergillus coremiiformis]
MRILSFFFFILIVPAATSYSQVSFSSPPQSSFRDILYWPITSSEPSIFARISFTPNTSEPNVISYSPPSTAQHESQGLVRVGLHTSNGIDPKHWTGTITSWAAIARSDGQKPMLLRLYIDTSNEFYHIALTSSSESHAASTSTSPKIQLVPLKAGSRPHLNRPVVVGPDGTSPEEAVEKTFFQKYWWVFLIITFLAMSGSGEEQ